jgi:hypothetical protein
MIIPNRQIIYGRCNAYALCKQCLKINKENPKAKYSCGRLIPIIEQIPLKESKNES